MPLLDPPGYLFGRPNFVFLSPLTEEVRAPKAEARTRGVPHFGFRRIGVSVCGFDVYSHVGQAVPAYSPGSPAVFFSPLPKR